MCGITGIVASNSNSYRDNLEKMISALKHRGPDENGRHFFNNCALGHTRLSIIDLSSGQQPMLSGDGKLGLSFNGEIYGYKKIKDEMIDYPFKTTSDTEVIIALYHKYGEKMIEKLPGMFAFALWDDINNQLFCARDKFGEKPFYYAKGINGEFIFGSEIKSILASNLIEPIMDLDSVSHYLKHLYVSPYKTIYKNIFTLPPAHALKVKDGNISIFRYWNYPSINENISADDAVKEFKNLFESAVKKQLIADVPVGAFLSGGLDSSTIVAIASKYTDKIKTFSFGFDGYNNELPYAKEIAKKYNTEHTELYARDYNISDLLIKMATIYDEPFADSSNIATYLISQMASNHAKVIITGDGGDEFCGGYGWYKAFLENDRAKGPSMSLALLKLSMLTFRKLNLPGKDEISYKYHNQMTKQFDSAFKMHAWQNSYFEPKELSQLLAINTKSDYCPHWDNHNNLDDIIRMDVDDYMPGDILVKVDRASMASGLELRAPFLDGDLASFCLSLPSSFKINKKEDKIILRRAFEDTWTDSIRKRSKQGFGAPVDKWLGQKNVIELKNAYLDNPKSKIFDIISYPNSRKYSTKNNYQTWCLLVLAIWMQQQKINLQ